MKICPYCNAQADDQATFCPMCGTRFDGDRNGMMPEQPSGAGQPYDGELAMQGQYDPVYAQSWIPQQHQEKAHVIPMTEWLWTVFLTYIPIVSLVMLIIWAVSSDTNPNKRNWARASLVVWLIVSGISTLFIILVAAGIVATGGMPSV